MRIEFGIDKFMKTNIVSLIFKKKKVITKRNHRQYSKKMNMMIRGISGV